MEETRKITNGTNGDRWLERLLTKFITIVVEYIIPYIIFVPPIILGLFYLLLWWAVGFVWLMILFGSVIVVSYALIKLSQHPEWKMFENKPQRFALVVKANDKMKIFRRSLGGLHAIQIALGLKVTKYVWKLQPRTKIIAAISIAIVVIPTFVLVSIKTVQIVQSKWPYGQNRSLMTPEHMAMRKENRINHAMWAVWGKKDAAVNAKCMDQYQSLINSSANKEGISPKRFEALLFVEGSCKPDQINKKSGAGGIAQIMLSVGCEEGLIEDKDFCKQVKKDKLLFIPKNKSIVDKRLDPNFAIPVAAKILGKATKYWGHENWAFVQYHMGVGNLRNLNMDYLDETYPGWRSDFPTNFSNVADPELSIPQAIAKYAITYDDIFFRCTPSKTPKTYSRLYRMSDDSATYVYTGLAALKGLDLMRSDYNAFLKMVAEQQDPDGGLANRPMRAWYANNLAKYNNREDVVSAFKGGELVPVLNDASNGFILRTTGADRIGECDPGNESSYYYTRKATAGMIYLIAAKVKEQEDVDVFEVTGLVRTNWMYDIKKCLPNTQPRTHVIGVAFDIGALIKGKPMSEKTRRALVFVIRDLRADGLIDRIAEGSADHIVYNPEFEKFFEEVYDDMISKRSPLV